MTIGRICSREVDLASVEETVAAAAGRMLRRNVGTLVVLDKDKLPVGVLTDRDLALRVVAPAKDANETTVADVMTEAPWSVHETATIEDTLRLMRAHAVRRLPVVAKNGELVGMVSVDDILGLIVEEFHEVGELLRAEAPGHTPPM